MSIDPVDAALAEIYKKYGSDAIIDMSGPIKDIDVIPSGNIQLDLALGVGGYARGRIVEVYGPESSGKTTLTLHAAAEAQKMGLKVLFIDAEHALDPAYAEAIGVDVEKLLINQPDDGEQGLDIALELIKSGGIGLVIIDSVAALTPRAEIAGDIGDSHVGLQARMMSQTLRMMNGAAKKTNTTVYFINQLREKIGVMFGSPETTTGGKSLKFYASQRLDIRRKDPIKSGAEIIGNQTKIKVIKNKVAPPFREALVEIYYGEGVSAESSLIDLGVEYGIIKKSGAWYTDWNGEQLGQGKPNTRLALKAQPEMVDELYDLVATKINEE